MGHRSPRDPFLVILIPRDPTQDRPVSSSRSLTHQPSVSPPLGPGRTQTYGGRLTGGRPTTDTEAHSESTGRLRGALDADWMEDLSVPPVDRDHDT